MEPEAELLRIITQSSKPRGAYFRIQAGSASTSSFIHLTGRSGSVAAAGWPRFV